MTKKEALLMLKCVLKDLQRSLSDTDNIIYSPDYGFITYGQVKKCLNMLGADCNSCKNNWHRGDGSTYCATDDGICHYEYEEPITNNYTINDLDDFIEYGKKAFGVELTIKKSDNPNTYEKLFGTTKNDLAHCQHTDEEIAKSFIRDAKTAKDQLPRGEQMNFPNTFDEFVNEYGFKDKDEVYTNGSELIPVFRVKQWLEHISTTKNDLVVDAVSRQAINEYIDYILNHGLGKRKSFDFIKKFVANLPPVTSQELSRNMKEIEEVINCDADAETKCKMISNILTAKLHYFEEAKFDMVDTLRKLQTDVDKVAHYRTKDDLTLVVDLDDINKIIYQEIDALRG